MERIQMDLKRLSLTNIVTDNNRVPKKKNLIEAMDKAGDLFCLFYMHYLCLTLQVSS